METLHPRQRAGKSIGTDATMDQLNSAAVAVLERLLTTGASSQAPQQAPCPIYQLANDLRIERLRIAATFERLFPNDAEGKHLERIDSMLCDVISELDDLSIDLRYEWLSGLRDQMKASAPQPIAEAPDSIATSGFADDAAEPLQPSRETLQVRIPGLSQLVPGEVTEYGTEDWKGGRSLITLVVSPEQFAALNVQVERCTDFEREQLVKAGYAVE